LTTDSSTLTACGNDMGFDALFERQIEALGRQGDVAVAISTSGNSANVLRGLHRAASMGLKTVGLTGGTGGKMRGVCDALIIVPSTVTARIQELHGMIGHVLCKALERRLGLVEAAP
jgi:D-sedoheptulose 7-phosphate isomerase